MSRDRADTYKLIQSSCALVGNWGTTDRRVTIIYAFCVLIHMYSDASFLTTYVERDLCTGMFQGTTCHRGGRGLGRYAGRQTQSCGCVRCNSKPRSGRVTATTELLVDETVRYTACGR